MLTALDALFSAFSDLVWSNVLWLLLAAGVFLLVYSRGLPYRYFGHALGVVSGRYDDREGPGQLTRLEALYAALSGTLGLGDIAGVAVAIATGGPGAVF